VVFTQFILVELEFEDVDLSRKRKTRVFGEKSLSDCPLEQGENRECHRVGIGPGTHWWEVSAFTTAPSLLPQKM